jgi:hypothetical protein
MSILRTFESPESVNDGYLAVFSSLARVKGVYWHSAVSAPPGLALLRDRGGGGDFAWFLPSARCSASVATSR